MATAKSKAARASAGKKTSSKSPETRSQEVLDENFERAESAVVAGTEAALKNYETAVAVGCEALDAACQAAKGSNGFRQSGFPTESFEALFDAGTTAVRGLRAVNQRLVDLTREQVQEGTAAQRALLSAKTFEEALEIQQQFLRRSFERVVHDGAEISELWLRTANGSVESAKRAAKASAHKDHQAA